MVVGRKGEEEEEEYKKVGLMNIELLEKNDKENKLSFILKDSTPVFANTLRRLIQEEVPTMAIEDVELRKNSSLLYDTIIGHRLGLLPLKTDLKGYTLPANCKCEGKGCARCQVKMTLSVKGPSTVYASDIKSKDSAIKPVFPKTPIVTLNKGQFLELEATAVLGQGKIHSKWCPGLVYYRQKPVIEISSSCNASIAEVCPTKTLESKDNKVVVSKEHLLDCHLCNACVEASNGAVKVEPTNDFVFYVESWGQLDCKNIFLEAAKSLNEIQEEFAEKVKALK